MTRTLYKDELVEEPRRFYTYAEVDEKLHERPKLNLDRDLEDQKELWY